MKKYKLTLNSLKKAQEAFCHGSRNSCCMDCPLHKAIHELQLNTCNDFIKYYPDKAAELMGLEVIEVEEKPKLTEQELNICKLLGTKWVSRDGEGYNYMGVVKLWREKPQIGNTPCYYLTEVTYIATCELEYFPSLKPGYCVNVEELLESSEQ